MPNHCQNVLTVKGKDAKKAWDKIVNDRGEVDFSLICPMPKELEADDDPATLVKGMTIIHEDCDSCGVPKTRAAENVKKYGYPNWYEWSCANWGTKWNAYECQGKTGNEVAFLTA